MDHRCPVCRTDLSGRKLSQAVVARMEIDCPKCGSRIRLNVHRVEVIVVLLSFGTIVVVGALAYWFQSRGLMLFTLGAVLAGSAAFPLLERAWLRTWPRYAPVAENPGH
jgi:DNA-directed RNA polymerase subunit RPC12/RpoP